MRARLSYHTAIDLEAYDAGIALRLVRLIAKIAFAEAGGWTETFRAIVDTGGPVSLIPRSIWEMMQFQLLSPRDFAIGIAGTPTTGKLAQLTVRFHDETMVSPPMNIKAYLLADDTHPLVLGFEDVLTDVALHSDFASGVAFLDLPETDASSS